MLGTLDMSRANRASERWFTFAVQGSQSALCERSTKHFFFLITWAEGALNVRCLIRCEDFSVLWEKNTETGSLCESVSYHLNMLRAAALCFVCSWGMQRTFYASGLVYKYFISDSIAILFLPTVFITSLLISSSSAPTACQGHDYTAYYLNITLPHRHVAC